jgi:hypothetical protein
MAAVAPARSEFQASRPACPFANVEARIWTGQEEVVFGWLSLNYLLGVCIPECAPSMSPCAAMWTWPILGFI